MKALLATILLAAAPAWAQLQDSIDRGQAVYSANCAGCHSNAGLGGGVVKALDGSAVVRTDAYKQARIMLDGVPGTLMGSWAARMTDAQLADVITYTRNAWSNKTGELIEPALIAEARKPPSPAPLDWPAPYGKGTAYKVATIAPDRDDRSGATAVCVAWWYVWNGAEWKPAYVWWDKFAPCMFLAPAGIAASALSAWWDSAKPRSLSAWGKGWAEAIWWQDHGKPQIPPPPPKVEYWVSKAPSNARPPKTRPTVPITGTAPSISRIAEYSPCDCDKYQNGSLCSVHTNAAAVCEAMP